MSVALSFLDYLSRREQRHYVILLDCGPSVRGETWNQAEQIVLNLLHTVCKAAPDGMSLGMFGEAFISVGNVRDEGSAVEALNSMAEAFAGATRSCLAEPLAIAVYEQQQSRRPTSILVVTAGVITDGIQVSLLVAGAIHRLRSYYELSISFLQVGKEMAGDAFLNQLAEEVRGDSKSPIVDIVPLSQLSSADLQLDDYISKSTTPFDWTTDGYRRRLESISSPAGSPDTLRRASHQPIDTYPTQKADLSFYNALASRLQRDYLVLLDCSSGMGLADYNVARHILSRTLASVFDLQSEGITVWMMQGSKTVGTEYITDGQKLDAVFFEHQPQGATRLSSGLRQTFMDYFTDPVKRGRKASFLVVVASPPKDWFTVTDLLVKAAVDDKYTKRLTVSFLNVGLGENFTKKLADEVNTRAGCVFVDSYQMPIGAPETAVGKARRVSVAMAHDADLVDRYVGDFLPDALQASQFTIQSSKDFYSQLQGRQ